MAIKSQADGSGEFGEIAPGWSVNEYATPTTIGEYAGGTGSVSFTAAAREDTVFIVGNEATTTIDDFGADETVTGVVGSVSVSGVSANISHGTALSKYDAQFDMPALGAGSPFTAMDLLHQVAGIDNHCIPTEGFLYTLRGHSSGFNSRGDIAKGQQWTRSVIRSLSSSVWTDTFTSQAGQIGAVGYVPIGPEVYADTVFGDSFREGDEYLSGRLFFKTLLNGGTLGLKVSGGEDSYISLADEGFFTQPLYVYMGAGVSNKLVIEGAVVSGGSQTLLSANVPLTGINLNAEIAVFIEWIRPTDLFGSHTLKATVCNTSNYSTTVTASVNWATWTPPYNSWTLYAVDGAKVRAIYRHDAPTPLGSTFTEYESKNFSFLNQVGSMMLHEPVPGVTAKSGWEYIQDMCSAYDVECAASDGSIVLRDLGTRILDISNRTLPNLSVSSVFSGRTVEVEYSLTEVSVDAELYNAYTDGNKVISVRAGETTVTTIETEYYPTRLVQPTYSTSPVSGRGQYKIISSDTDTSPNISEAAWRDYGGTLEVRINESNPRAIDVIMTGPFQDIPGYTGPYKLAYTSGNEYAALSIVGSGVKAAPRVLKLYTTANPEKVFQQTARTVRNIFVGSMERAYDKGLSVSLQASGPSTNISFTIPLSSVDGLGLTPGSLFRYQDSIYRVADSTISGLNVSLNAVRWTRVSDFEGTWASGTVGFFDDLWVGNQVSDVTIKPLWFIGDDEPLVLLFDEDDNPYFSFHGNPEMGLFVDTDGRYYYVPGDIDGEVSIYLDSDFKPYAGV